MELADPIIVALARHFAKQAEKLRLQPGIYQVSQTLTIELAGAVEKAPDLEYTPTADIPLIPALALLLKRSGVQREAAKALLIEVMTEALNSDEDARAALEEEAGVLEAMKHVRQITAALPKKTKQGATKVAVAVKVAARAARDDNQQEQQKIACS